MKFTQSNTLISGKLDFKHEKFPEIVITGNPNSGKTALFNRLTGLHHKVGNYPGVTVEKKSGWLRGHRIEVQDLPGTYSLNARSQDEKIVSRLVSSWRKPENRPRAVVVVVDATNLARNIYLALQLLEFPIPVIIVLNMMDEVRKQGLQIDVERLQEILQAHAIIPVSAKQGEGIAELIDVIISLNGDQISQPVSPKLKIDPKFLTLLEPLNTFYSEKIDRLTLHPVVDSLRSLGNDHYLNELADHLSETELIQLRGKLAETESNLKEAGFKTNSPESGCRYAYIDDLISEVIKTEPPPEKSFSEKLDSFLTHPIFGPVSLILVLGIIFNSIFSWAEYPMGWIESAVEWLSVSANILLPDGAIKSLISDGIIAGVGNVIVFLPQILLLIFFISLLEDSGYMARMAFIMDRLMRKFGLHGKAVLPMLSGFACAIPAIMSSRTIESWRDRLITIMLIPLMSCSARLPVYTLLIAAFIPHKTVLGFFQMQSLVLMGVYFLGFFTAVGVAVIMKKLGKRKGHRQSNFVLELPPYRLPMVRSVGWKVYNSAKLFLVNAGSIILALSIVMWFLASYPKSNAGSGKQVEQSFAGQLGHLVEPVIKPLGFDWKIGVGIISSFAAREVLVSTFATIYNVQEADNEGNISLIEALQNDRDKNGQLVFSPLVAVSLMVFFVYAAQCMSTFAIIRRETNSWKWPMIMVLYMNILAYAMSFITFQGGKLLGAG